MARRIGDPETLAYAISGYTQANLSPEFTPRQAGLATELIELATQVGDRERSAEGRELRGIALLELADMARAKTEFAAMAEVAQQLRQPSQRWVATVYSALVALVEESSVRPST